MKEGTTLFLKIAIMIIAIPIIALCLFGLPLIAKEAGRGSVKMAYVMYGILTIMYVSAIPFFTALYQGFKLLSYIDTNQAFSDISVVALKKIKNAATTISIMYVVAMPLFYVVGEIDDAPGIIIIGMIFIFAPMTIAVFAAVLQKLLKHAIDIKNDNDLTI
ncbi:MAG TPA: DUF2975 domain-containing protein [Epulopiscium sp.]|nr:DUF2975 domain-containing protein [Candidatus Epulonipiscium sp.]